MPNARWVALTGGLAEGKSTILNWISEAGVRTASADAVVEELWEDQEFVREIGLLLGIPMPTKAVVRDTVATDLQKRHQLNAWMHPLVWGRLLHSGAQVVEVPLLIETCIQDRFDKVWVATCGLEEQRRRLFERLGSYEAVDGALSTQLQTSVKLAFADRIFRTNIPRSDVQQLVLAAVAAEGFEI